MEISVVTTIHKDSGTRGEWGLDMEHGAALGVPLGQMQPVIPQDGGGSNARGRGKQNRVGQPPAGGEDQEDRMVWNPERGRQAAT